MLVSDLIINLSLLQILFSIKDEHHNEFSIVDLRANSNSTCILFPALQDCMYSTL